MRYRCSYVFSDDIDEDLLAELFADSDGENGSERKVPSTSQSNANSPCSNNLSQPDHGIADIRVSSSLCTMVGDKSTSTSYQKTNMNYKSSYDGSNAETMLSRNERGNIHSLSSFTVGKTTNMSLSGDDKTKCMNLFERLSDDLNPRSKTSANKLEYSNMSQEAGNKSKADDNVESRCTRPEKFVDEQRGEETKKDLEGINKENQEEHDHKTKY